MTSNTAIGRASKGSKFWMQTLVKIDCGAALNKAIRNLDPNIGSIEWKSPVQEEYKELKTNQIEQCVNLDLSFWPNNGPWWDAVGIDENGCILLVEAKGHINETLTKCSAKSENSIIKIKRSMKEVHDQLAPSHTCKVETWFNKYYQLGNRLTFLVKLRSQGVSAKIVLLNIVNDPTNVWTSEVEWMNHYANMFNEMIGQINAPRNVLVVNFPV